MIPVTADEFLPLELVFNPNWWFQTAGISFDKPFYFDAETRIRNDVVMRRVLYERYGELGLGEVSPQPRPIIGSVHVAGGFVLPALFGVEVSFSPDAPPQPERANLTAAQVEALEKPDPAETWPMQQIMADVAALEARYGYVVGDLNTDGILNTAYHLRGQELFLDFHDNPQRTRRLLALIGQVIVAVADYLRQHTGSCSISVNRMAGRVTPALFLHGNCNVQMISPRMYREVMLPVEQDMAGRLQPYGIHHCGNNMHMVAPAYAELPASFFDVGWGSDVARCREFLPDAFFNLRLSPVRMLQNTPAQMAEDTEKLLLAAGPLDRAGVCCINMDYGTPDDNIFAVAEVVQRYRRYGA